MLTWVIFIILLTTIILTLRSVKVCARRLCQVLGLKVCVTRLKYDVLIASMGIDCFVRFEQPKPSISVSVHDSCLIPFQCRKAEYEGHDEDIPMENIRYVEPGIKQPNAINLFPLDKYAYAPESNL